LARPRQGPLPRDHFWAFRPYPACASRAILDDDAPPDHLDDLEVLRAADRFRFANDLGAWIEVRDGVVVDAGYSGGGVIGSTTVRLGARAATLEAFPLPDIQLAPEISGDSARFVQTAGGRTGLPAPRRVNHPPYVQFRAPIAWTTLALEIRNDGTSSFEVVGASAFPRHWIYDAHGDVTAKVGLIEFKRWWRKSFGRHTPWGDETSPAFVTAVETALERSLSTTIMRAGTKPRIRKYQPGESLMEQGERGDELLLVLDGVVSVIVDGEPLVELGPGAVLGERAGLEGGMRTATVRAATKCRAACVSADQIEPSALEELSLGHRREER
jgi:Cyclic nucleotide-binding domain